MSQSPARIVLAEVRAFFENPDNICYFTFEDDHRRCSYAAMRDSAAKHGIPLKLVVTQFCKANALSTANAAQMVTDVVLAHDICGWRDESHAEVLRLFDIPLAQT